jgi:hypothetical protein
VCRHRPAPSRALTLTGFLQLFLATPALAIDSIVHGAVVDTSIGTSAVGDSLMGEYAVNSPEWSRLAILWTYDEVGGFADHVPPPRGCRAAPSSSPFTERGPRVPFVVISPWARRNYVSHVVRDHTAITRFIETLFDLSALTARDANSDALLDMFDFSCGRDLSVAPAPAAGTGLCTNPAPSGANLSAIRRARLAANARRRDVPAVPLRPQRSRVDGGRRRFTVLHTTDGRAS